MRWRVFRPTPAPLTDAALLAHALETVAPQVTALTAPLAPALVQAVVTPLLQRWVALCWDGSSPPIQSARSQLTSCIH